MTEVLSRNWQDISEELVVDLIRDGSKGHGLEAADVTVWMHEHGLPPEHASEVLDALKEASELIVNAEHRQAVRNAMNVDQQPGNLTERRISYLTNVDITYRTLIRHETEGARAIAAMLPRILAGQEQGSVAVMESLNQINERLAKIETMLSGRRFQHFPTKA